MENPKSVTRFLAFSFIAILVAVVAASICCREYSLLLGWLAVLAVFVVACLILNVANVAIFTPIFWLMSRFERRRGNDHARQEETHDDQLHNV